jgi:hypothetical protein
MGKKFATPQFLLPILYGPEAATASERRIGGRGRATRDKASSQISNGAFLFRWNDGSNPGGSSGGEKFRLDSPDRETEAPSFRVSRPRFRALCFGDGRGMERKKIAEKAIGPNGQEGQYCNGEIRKFLDSIPIAVLILQ